MRGITAPEAARLLCWGQDFFRCCFNCFVRIESESEAVAPLEEPELSKLIKKTLVDAKRFFGERLDEKFVNRAAQVGKVGVQRS